jgi:hypothetical protein
VAKLPPPPKKTNSSYKFGNFFIEQEIWNKMLPFTCNGQNMAKFRPFYFFEKTPI